ncbi:MAG: Thermostable carboxypeptidase 1 [Micavibrio sp.]|nr:Thermostable carboxypeptidase 1 [Micavibrio sp.]
MNIAYENLKDRYRLLSNLNGAGSILYMDSMVVMKPGSEADRSEQSMALATAAQKLLTHPEVGDWLDEAEESASALSPADQTNLRLMRRQWISYTAIPETLVRESARLGIEGNNLHTKHRDKGDWNVMRPIYEAAFNTQREIGEILKGALGFATTYEALLDQFSPGLKLSTVEREFAKLEQALPGMIAEATRLQKDAGQVIPLPEVPLAILQVIGNKMLLDMGFDDNRGILYVGDMHPLSGGTPDDSRLTTRYNPKDPLDGLYTVAHECGHSLYEQGTPAAWRYQPAGHSMGMDVHESQSMIMELQACRTPEFMEHLAKEFSAHIQNPAFSAENIAKALFRVEPSFIRIHADELTYPLHIILRFNLERDIIAGKLSVADLPDAWNAGMDKSFGIIPAGPTQGHMQDVHWPTLSVGYFPAYTLGAMGAAQFFAAAVKAHPEIRDELRHGQFKTLRRWLEINVHSKGSLLTQDELFTAATGEPLNAKYFMNSLSRRYLGRDYTA